MVSKKTQGLPPSRLMSSPASLDSLSLNNPGPGPAPPNVARRWTTATHSRAAAALFGRARASMQGAVFPQPFPPRPIDRSV